MATGNSRIISELLPKTLYFWSNPKFRRSIERYLFVYLLLFFVFLFLLSSVLFQIYKSAVEKRKVEEGRLVYWEEIITNHPEYPDGYYKAAVSALRLRDTKKAYELLEKAIQLDPEFNEARELQKSLQ